MVHLIPTYEQDGLNVRICCLMIDAKDGMNITDIREAIEKASTEYCKTPRGKATYEGNCCCFNYGDFDAYVPNTICKKYGIKKVGDDIKYEEPINYDEQLVCEGDIFEEEE